ncbi:MAG: thioredoxin [Luteibaculaceae bacterium]
MALTINETNFEELVMKADKPVLVDFWAEWCGPCRAIGPIIEDLSKDFDGKAVIAKVNVDENPNIASQFGIRSIPTILLLKGGEIVDKQVGLVPKEVLAEKINKQLA